jgi:hypothetical protein
MSSGTDPSKITVDLASLGLDNQQSNRSQNVSISNVEPLKLETLNEGTLGLETLRFTKNTKDSNNISDD